MKNASMNKTRRDVLARSIAIAVSAVTACMGARRASASPQAAAEMLRQLAAGAPSSGRVNIDTPDIAENGNAVPVVIRVDSPMTDADFVEALHIAADGNPNPGVASFYFRPINGRAEVELRIRLAQSQRIIAVARMNDGSVWTATREIKVALGGCGG